MTARKGRVETVALGHSRDIASRAAADAFAAAWKARDGKVLTRVDWPESAASWLRPARRLTAEEPDAWVMAAAPLGFAQLARRLRHSTDWDPARTVAFAALKDSRLPALAGPETLHGLRGATAEGGTWEVRNRWVTSYPPAGRTRMTALIPRPRHGDRPRGRAPARLATLDQQRELVTACRAWATGPVPIRHTRLPRGGVMSVQTVCVGWHWQPYQYTRVAADVNGERVAEFPDWMVDLGRRALTAAYGDARARTGYTPDTALINFYDAEAKMGMHQDKDERPRRPSSR